MEFAASTLASIVCGKRSKSRSVQVTFLCVLHHSSHNKSRKWFMHAMLRPYVTAGVSIIGASAIAISPISPVPAALPDISFPAHAVSTAAVNLAASPIDFYTDVFSRTTVNLGTLAGTLIGDPAPILTQVIKNQVANANALIARLAEGADNLAYAVTVFIPQQLRTASAALANGDVEGAVNALLDIPVALAFPILDTIYDAIVTPIMLAAGRINNVIQNTPGTIILAGAIAIMGPVISTIGAIGSAVQDVIDAAGSGDIVKVVQAVVNAPGVVVDGFLNGGYGPLMLGYIPAPGILSAVDSSGPIAAALAIRQLIAQQLAPVPQVPFSGGALRSGVDELSGAALFDAKSVALEGSAGDVQGDSTAGETDTGGGADDNGADGAEGDGAGGTDLGGGDGTGEGAGAGAGTPEGDAGDEGEVKGKPGGGTDLTKGNKVEPGKVATKPNGQNKVAQEPVAGTVTPTDPTVGGDKPAESPTGAAGVGAEGGDNTGGDNTGGDTDS
jgi:hypothetical protein